MENNPMQQQSQQQSQHPLANYQFSGEELRVLRECNTESFFQRSLPFSTALGVGTYFGVKQGFLQPNVKYGSVPKVVVSVIIGYFIGKFSYQQKCAEKLMKLPNSRIGEVLRQRKYSSNNGVMSRLAPDQNISAALALPFTPSGVTDIYSDENVPHKNRSTALNLDTERPVIPELDDVYRPSLDAPSIQFEPEIPVEPKPPGMTYDELRKRNREDYENRQKNIFSHPLPSEAPVITRKTDKQKERDEQMVSVGQKNKYGDTWTE